MLLNEYVSPVQVAWHDDPPVGIEDSQLVGVQALSTGRFVNCHHADAAKSSVDVYSGGL